MRYSIDTQIAEGDEVVSHCSVSGTRLGPLPLQAWMLRLPTGKHFTVKHMHRFRLRDGKIVARWAVRDDLGMLVQLGHVAP